MRRICASTSTSRAVVGSSATMNSGSQHEGQRDHDPLPHATGELVRIVVDSGSAGCPARAALPARGRSRSPVGEPGSWVRSISAKCSLIRISGSSRVIGSWKIRPSSGPRSCRSSLGAAAAADRCPRNTQLPSIAAPRAAGRAHRGRASTCRSRTHRRGRAISPRPTSKRHPVDRPHRRRGPCRTRPAGRGTDRTASAVGVGRSCRRARLMSTSLHSTARRARRRVAAASPAAARRRRRTG